MTVKELIKELEKLPKDKVVYTYKEHEYWMNWINWAYEYVDTVYEDWNMIIIETTRP